MKSMTCNQLGGACDEEFRGETFEEVAEKSRQHGIEMAEKNDKPHLDAMEKMKQMMQNPKDMQEWMESKKQKFESQLEDQ